MDAEALSVDAEGPSVDVERPCGLGKGLWGP